MSEATCHCGAVGAVVPADFSYGCRDAVPPLMLWRGGRVGSRVAVEDARSGASTCPECRRRAPQLGLGA